MKSMGIRELKATLSRQLDDVKRGEVVLVTDRGKVVAELRSPGSASAVARSAFELSLEAWMADGRITVGPANRAEWYPPAPIALPEGTASQVLDEIRGEG